MPIVMDAIALNYESLTHFTPTTAQRKTLAKSGIAMPDGSFYIRDQSELSDAIRAVGRATPNAGESDTARRNAVRRHIIKRASALKLSNMIPDTWNSDGSLKQSAILVEEVEEFLQHFGRKGMKWGEHIFGDRNSGTQSKPSRADKKFEKAATSSSTAQKLHTTALIRLQQEDLPKLNNNPRYREHSLLSDPARQREYDNKIEAAYLRHLSEVASEQRSASGKKTYSIETKPLPDGTHEWKVHVKDVSHADKSFTVRPVRDPKTGLITDIKFVSDAMTQSALSEEFIAHFGRKGMKWGEHIFGRDRGGSSTVHPDAARASVSLATAKKHGTSALSTHDLRDLNNRLQQERQFSQLTAQRKSEGRKFVEQELRQQGHQALAVYGPKLAVKGAAWVATHIARVGFG